MTTALKPSDVLKAALAKLSRRGGWCQKASSRGKYAMCSYGAICSSSEGLSAGLRSLRVAMQCLRRSVGRASIVQWNDDPKRKKSEVLAAFRKAIRLALKKERR